MVYFYIIQGGTVHGPTVSQSVSQSVSHYHGAHGPHSHSGLLLLSSGVESLHIFVFFAGIALHDDQELEASLAAIDQ